MDSRFTRLREGLLLAQLLFMLSAAGAAHAQTALKITPPIIKLTPQKSTFTVEVLIKDAQHLRAYSIELLYDETMLTHKSVKKGNVFNGYSDLFLTSKSNASEGYLLIDHALLGSYSVSGTEAVAFSVTFELIGSGTSTLSFGETKLRDLNNADLVHQQADPATVFVGLPPLAHHTEQVLADQAGGSEVSFGTTGALIRFGSTGEGGTITVARYEIPSSDEEIHFIDPDGDLQLPSLASHYWEITSSVSGASSASIAFNYADLAGLHDPKQLRVAWRPLAAETATPWEVIPRVQTQVNEGTEQIVIDVPVSLAGKNGLAGAGSLSGQYVLMSGAANPVPTEADPVLPQAYVLGQNYPNPFNPSTQIAFVIPEAARTMLKVYDLIGHEVATLIDAHLPPGRHAVAFAAGHLSSGLYLYALEVNGQRLVRQMTLLK